MADLINIAQNLEEDELKEIAARVIEDYNKDEDSRSGWLEMHAKWLDLYYQQDVPKQRPWENSSEESVPLLAEACNQFHARAYPAFFPNRSIIKAIQTGRVDEQTGDRAKRVGRHMSWQCMEQDRTYKRNKDSLLLAVPLHGSFFTKTYYDPGKKVPLCTKNVRAVDLVIPYGTGPRQLENIDRKTEIIWMSVNDGKIREKSGYFIAAPQTYTGADKNAADEANDQAQGVEDPQDVNGDAKVLEQHRSWDLDDDGIEEPYVITVDSESEKVLRIVPRYEVDEEGNATDAKRPIEYYTHYMFLPNPDGFYGLGLGHLIGKINTAVNKMLRQTVDAGTLENLKSGFISSALQIEGGDLEMVMGKFKKIPNVDRLEDHIHEMRFSGPSQALMEVMNLLMQRSDRLATVTEALTGQTDKVMQPTTILALIEQGLKMFSTVYERLWESWADELLKRYRLNSKYLDLVEYFTVNDLDGATQYEVAQSDYADDLMVVPIADPKMATEQQKLARAEAQWQFAISNPFCVNNPQAFYEATRRHAEVLEFEGIDMIFPPPEQKQEVRVDDPMVENMGAMFPMPQIPPVYPDQNHLEHIKAHEGFLESEYAQKTTPEGLQALQAHTQTHWAYLYGTVEAELDDEFDQERGGTVAQTAGDTGSPPAYTGSLPPELAGGEQPGGPEQVEGAG